MQITELAPTPFDLPGRADPVYIATERWALEPWEGEDSPDLGRSCHREVCAVAVSRARLVLGVPLRLAVSEITYFWLRRANPHPLGLTAVEPTMPKMLGTHGWGGSLTCMSLAYGYRHPGDVSRPLIEVMTCFLKRGATFCRWRRC